MTKSNFPQTKSAFKNKLQHVNAAYYSGNDFWFDAAQYGHDEDQNLFVDFVWNDTRFLLEERVGYTNGGASWSAVYVTAYGSEEIVYEDYFHDGNGAWQTGDSSDARCEYSELTEYILKIFRSYVK